MKHFLSLRFPALLFVVFVLISLTGCSVATPQATEQPAQTPETQAASPTPAPTSTPQPTPTERPPRAILLAPDGSDLNLVASIQQVLQPAVEGAGLVFEQLSALSAAELGPDVRLVVAIPPDSGLNALVQAAPTTQFLAVGLPGLQAAPNLSVLGSQGDRPDQQGFLAGYLTAAITEDWRVGVISISDTASGKAARNAFLRGAVYMCGLCRPSYPPYVQYPVYAEVPSGASQTDLQAAADTLIGQGVQTVYVYPAAANDALLQYLAQKEISIVGGSIPAGGVQSQWIASIRTDPLPALIEMLPALLAGEGGTVKDVPLMLTDMNPERFSEGRQQFVNEFLGELTAGRIDPGVDLATGDLR